MPAKTPLTAVTPSATAQPGASEQLSAGATPTSAGDIRLDMMSKSLTDLQLELVGLLGDPAGAPAKLKLLESFLSNQRAVRRVFDELDVTKAGRVNRGRLVHELSVNRTTGDFQRKISLLLSLGHSLTLPSGSNAATIEWPQFAQWVRRSVARVQRRAVR
jgi:hypothetical protein